MLMNDDLYTVFVESNLLMWATCVVVKRGTFPQSGTVQRRDGSLFPHSKMIVEAVYNSVCRVGHNCSIVTNKTATVAAAGFR